MMSFLTRALDWEKYLVRMLPLAFRNKASHVDLVNLLSTGLVAANVALVNWRLFLYREYRGGGQRMVLERILRVQCANGAAQIWVVNNSEARERYDLYARQRMAEVVAGHPREELEPIGPELNGYIYNRIEEQDNSVDDFTVQVSATLWSSLSTSQRLLLSKLVDRFKLYGTRYSIVIV